MTDLTWAPVTSMSSGRSGQGSAEISGTLYVVGGMASLNVLANKTRVFGGESYGDGRSTP